MCTPTKTTEGQDPVATTVGAYIKNDPTLYEQFTTNTARAMVDTIEAMGTTIPLNGDNEQAAVSAVAQAWRTLGPAGDGSVGATIFVNAALGLVSDGLVASARALISGATSVADGTANAGTGLVNLLNKVGEFYSAPGLQMSTGEDVQMSNQAALIASLVLNGSAGTMSDTGVTQKSILQSSIKDELSQLTGDIDSYLDSDNNLVLVGDNGIAKISPIGDKISTVASGNGAIQINTSYDASTGDVKSVSASITGQDVNANLNGANLTLKDGASGTITGTGNTDQYRSQRKRHNHEWPQCAHRSR